MREKKTLTEQVEEHFKYMASRAWHKPKILKVKDQLWRPPKRKLNG
jgi:hypothetical protein